MICGGQYDKRFCPSPSACQYPTIYCNTCRCLQAKTPLLFSPVSYGRRSSAYSLGTTTTTTTAQLLLLHPHYTIISNKFAHPGNYAYKQASEKKSQLLYVYVTNCDRALECRRRAKKVARARVCVWSSSILHPRSFIPRKPPASIKYN